MRFRLTVLDKKGNILHQPEFDSMEEMNKHALVIQECTHYVFPYHQEVVTPDDGSPEYIKNVPDFDIVVEDISAKVDADMVKEQQKKILRQDRIAAFKAINWTNIDTIAKIKVIVKALVEDQLKDE